MPMVWFLLWLLALLVAAGVLVVTVVLGYRAGRHMAKIGNAVLPRASSDETDGFFECMVVSLVSPTLIYLAESLRLGNYWAIWGWGDLLRWIGLWPIVIVVVYVALNDRHKEVRNRGPEMIAVALFAVVGWLLGMAVWPLVLLIAGVLLAQERWEARKPKNQCNQLRAKGNSRV